MPLVHQKPQDDGRIGKTDLLADSKGHQSSKRQENQLVMKQVKNLHLLILNQPKQGPKQVEPVCYKCGKKDRHSSQRRMNQKPTCYRYGKRGHRATERPKV